MKTKLIVQIIFQEAQALDITGPVEVFAQARKFLLHDGQTKQPAYETILISTDGQPVTMSSGIRMLPDMSFESFSSTYQMVDTLVISGGNGVKAVQNNKQFINFIKNHFTKSRRIASICTGTFALAKTGLLNGKRATTHWDSCRKLADEHPEIIVEPDMIFVKDENIYSSAGVTAGIDLALALVEEDFGREIALKIAKQLVVFMKRQGGQSQFSTTLAQQHITRNDLQDTLDWMKHNSHKEFTIETLASRAAMSERNFARIFKRNIGMTPGKYIEKMRVEVAVQLIESSNDNFGAIAEKSGFSSEEMLRRAFIKQLNVLPNIYRKRFGK